MKEHKNFKYKAYYLGFTVIILALAFIFGVLFYSVLAGKIDSNTVNRIDFTLLISGLMIFTTASILLPEFTMKQKIKDAVREYAKNEIDEIATAQIAKKSAAIQNEIKRVNAHLSRMTAFSLVDKYPVWSIGWSFRSLKTYQSLDSITVGRTEYLDFIAFIEKRIITSAVQNFFDRVNQAENIGTGKENDAGIIENALACISSEQRYDDDDTDGIRTAVRAVKDMVDFEYQVYFEKQSDLTRQLQNTIENICTQTVDFCTLICAALMHYYCLKSKEIGSKPNPVEKFYEVILEISAYGKKRKNYPSRELQKDFSTKLHTSLEYIEKHKKNFIFYENRFVIKDSLTKDKTKRLFFRTTV